MVWGSWLGLVVALSGQSNVHPQQIGPSEICTSGRPNPDPPAEKGWGVTGYVLRGEVDEGSLLVPRIENLRKRGFDFTAADVNGQPLLLVTSPAGRIRSVAALKKEIGELCGLETGGQLQVARINYETAKSRREIARVNREYRKEQKRWRIADAKEARDQARYRVQARKNLPQLEEVQAILAAGWADYSYQLRMEGMTFGRVRDLSECRRRGGWFSCMVGVTATSDRGPEYEQATFKFWRDENAALHIQEDEILVIN